MPGEVLMPLLFFGSIVLAGVLEIVFDSPAILRPFAIPFVLIPWSRALLAGVRVSFFKLVVLRLRGVNPSTIVRYCITAANAGLAISTDELIKHYRAGGHIEQVIFALTVAKEIHADMTWRQATAIDLAGHDVLSTVQGVVR
jgi:uncharacterized protein YqfA (UPF0365 family)